LIFFIFGKPHPLSACFFFVAGEGERARKCREAVRQSVQCREIQEVENPMGVEKRGKKGETRAEWYQWDRYWHIRKSNEKHTI